MIRMAVSSYEIRVVGSLGPAARKAFADLSVDVEPTTTVLSGDLSQDDLHALFDRVRALGLELVDVRQAPSRPESPVPVEEDTSDSSDVDG